MPALPAAARARHSLITLLQGETQNIDESLLHKGETLRIISPGKAEGPMFCGCLSVLASLVGGPCMPDLQGKILCIEDIDERPYAIDRALWQLYLAGHLNGLRALIGGRFPVTDASQQGRGPSLDSIMQEWANRLQIPIAYGLPFGHEDDPIALPCGGFGQLNFAEQWSINCQLNET